MISKDKFPSAKKRTMDYFERAKIVITEAEKEKIEIADFGLGDLDTFGLELLTYINTKRVCSKEMVLFPKQTCPEHMHPSINGVPGKEETFRCRWGKVYLYVQGPKSDGIKAVIPPNSKECFTAFHQVELNPGEQYTIMPDTMHWFQAGENGAVVSEFSTMSTDELDRFTDKRIIRKPEVEG